MLNQQLGKPGNVAKAATVSSPRPPKLEQNLLNISSAAFAWRITLWAGLMVMGVCLTLRPEVWASVAGILVLGTAMAHGVELSHQALHHTGFRSPRLNEIFGLMLGLPMLVSFYEYRIHHLKHHALLGTPENREFFDYGPKTWEIKSLVLRFFMLHHYISFSMRLVKALSGQAVGDYHPRYKGKVRLFYIISALALTALLAACWFSTSFAPLLIWLAALFIVASPLHAFIEMPEHYGCIESSIDPFENTRTIRSNWFMSWLTNHNNFHVEHHMWADVPIQNIHFLHERCRHKTKYFNRGYWEFYKEALRNAHGAGSAKP
jgi:fatty acid desaturase